MLDVEQFEQCFMGWVSAWSAASRLVLGQRKDEGHSNGITEIPQLLRNLDVSGCVVSIDAMGCQRKVAQTIVEGEVDYVLALKRNQRELYDDVKHTFEQWDESVGDFLRAGGEVSRAYREAALSERNG